MNSGILLIDKPIGKTSFFLVRVLRKITGIRKIGHAGTLDPLATGVMVMLVGKEATRLSSKIIGHDKTYEMTILLGSKTTTLDTDGDIIKECDLIPSHEEVSKALIKFQGVTNQTPPMFSAKKIDGKKLYELAREGKEVARKSISVTMKIELIDYSYPNLKLRVECSSGTYMRTLADDLGEELGSFGTTSQLRRIKSGPFNIKDCIELDKLEEKTLKLLSIHEVCEEHCLTT